MHILLQRWSLNPRYYCTSFVRVYVYVYHNVELFLVFVSGRAVEWLNTAKQVPSILKRLAEAFKKLLGSLDDRKRRDLTSLEERMTTVMSDGIGATVSYISNLDKRL